MAISTITYADSLFFPALLRAIEGAQSSVEILTFVCRTNYVGETRVRQSVDALKAAAERGVQVLVILNYARFEVDVAAATQWTGNLWPIDTGMLFRMNANLNTGRILTSNEVGIALMP